MHFREILSICCHNLLILVDLSRPRIQNPLNTFDGNHREGALPDRWIICPIHPEILGAPSVARTVQNLGETGRSPPLLLYTFIQISGMLLLLVTRPQRENLGQISILLPLSKLRRGERKVCRYLQQSFTLVMLPRFRTRASRMRLRRKSRQKFALLALCKNNGRAGRNSRVNFSCQTWETTTDMLLTVCADWPSGRSESAGWL